MHITSDKESTKKKKTDEGDDTTPRLTFEEKQELSLLKKIETAKQKNEKKEKKTAQDRAKKERSESQPFHGLVLLMGNKDENKELEKALENNALTLFENIRWNNGKVCPNPKCGHTRIWQFKTNSHKFKCAKCKKQFNAKAGTIFKRSQISVRNWLVAIYQETNSDGGVTARKLADDIKVCRKTATIMLQKIRRIGCDQAIFPFSGTKNIQADHTFVGGSKHNVHISDRDKYKDRKNKTPIMVLVEENGMARAQPEKDTKQTTVIKYVSNVLPIYSGAVIYTDQAKEFNILGKYYTHHTINHSHGQYAKTEGSHRVTTNTVEGFNSHMKTGFMVRRNFTPKNKEEEGKKFMDYFVNAAIFRYNTRHNTVYEKIVLALTNIALAASITDAKVIPFTSAYELRKAA